ncbi:MAG: alanine--glyoxylate aminotransferase family protein [Syntrophorhabdaceae bacterium]|nr:alanine--glyoxylate aminotransferase family protein [Syntrophorhabdaceae bacterium]
MKNLLDGIEEILLMGPGPSCVPEEVYKALSKKTLGHLDPYFLEIMEELKDMLRKMMNTKNNLTIPISGTGSAGMETSFVNLIEPGDRVLILLNGVFGMRMQDVATRLGAHVDVLEFPWGKSVIPEVVEKKVKENSYKIVAVVHAETSTGVRNPVDEIGDILGDSETIYLVDSVTGLGGIEVRMDDWNIDVLYSGTQKCLSCPPGLAPLSFSDRAMAKLNARKTKVPNWYLDLTMIANYWGQNRVYHHTAPVNMLYGLYQALFLILEEGPENVFRRHLDAHKMLVAGLEEIGLKMLVEEKWRLPMLNAVCTPDNKDELSIRRRLRSEHKIEIGGGLGPLSGKIWRIGLMGHTARQENVSRLLRALKSVLS